MLEFRFPVVTINITAICDCNMLNIKSIDHVTYYKKSIDTINYCIQMHNIYNIYSILMLFL